jgi:hypothetical protein
MEFNRIRCPLPALAASNTSELRRRAPATMIERCDECVKGAAISESKSDGTIETNFYNTGDLPDCPSASTEPIK